MNLYILSFRIQNSSNCTVGTVVSMASPSSSSSFPLFYLALFSGSFDVGFSLVPKCMGDQKGKKHYQCYLLVLHASSKPYERTVLSLVAMVTRVNATVRYFRLMYTVAATYHTGTHCSTLFHNINYLKSSYKRFVVIHSFMRISSTYNDAIYQLTIKKLKILAEIKLNIDLRVLITKGFLLYLIY